MTDIVPYATTLRDAGNARDTPYTLPRAERWIPGESILGLLVRNTKPQGFERPGLLLSRIREETQIEALGIKNLDDGEAEAFANLLGMDRAAFDLMHHGSNNPGKLRLFGNEVNLDFVSVVRRKVCPLCLRESQHHRSVWDFSLLTVCPKHGIPLVDRCSKCSRVLTWATPSLEICSNLQCLEAVDHPVDPSPSGEWPIAGYCKLVDVVMNRPCAEAPSWPVNAIIKFCFAVGNVVMDAGSRRPIRFAREQPELVPRIIDAGWQAISDWPHGFRRLLCDLRAKSGSRGERFGLKKEFGKLASLLSMHANDPDAKPLLDEVAIYVSAQPDLATRKWDLRKNGSDYGHLEPTVTGVQAKKILGLSYELTFQFAERFDLWLVAPSGSGAASLVRKDRLLDLASRLSDLIDRKVAADILNVSRGTFKMIEKVGLVQPIPEAERLLPKGIYSREAINAFLARIEACVVSHPAGVDHGRLEGVDTFVSGHVSMAFILSSILSGAVPLRDVDQAAVGLQRLKLDPGSVRPFLRPPEPAMSTTEASVVLGVKAEVAYHWVNRGLIPTVAGAIQGRRITPKSLEEFAKNYVTGTEIAKRLGVRARWLTPKLVERGLMPVSSPEQDGCQQFLFRRAEADALDLGGMVTINPSGKASLRRVSSVTNAARKPRSA